MSEILEQVFQVGFFAATVRIAAPLVLATLGEMFAERAGVLNLGIEGIMLLGAMSGFTVAYFSGSLWLGMAAAAASGIVFGALMAVLAVTLGLSQHVSGLGVTMLCTGLSFYCYRLIFGQPSQPPNLEELLRKGQDRLKQVIPGGGSGKFMWVSIFLGLVGFWLMITTSVVSALALCCKVISLSTQFALISFACV